MVIGSSVDLAQAETYARADPFVMGGYSRAEVRPWQWSHPENGHLGATEPSAGSHPRFLRTLQLRPEIVQFCSRSIDDQLVQALLAAALAAPSTDDLRPWRPIVCHAVHDRQRLERCGLDPSQLGAVALAVVCAVDPAVFEIEDPREASLLAGAIFGQQFLLAGISQGLAGLWLGGHDEQAIREQFGLPAATVVAGVVGLGQPATQRRLPSKA